MNHIAPYTLPMQSALRKPLKTRLMLFSGDSFDYISLMSAQPAGQLSELVENFALFDDWEERYRYLIDLGRSLPAMPDEKKTDEALVKGCTSRVWMHVTKQENGRFHFEVDSDAHIVRGLVALLLSAYQGKTAQEIAAIDIASAFSEIGLDQHLSPNRRNGFFAMVEKVKAYSA